MSIRRLIRATLIVVSMAVASVATVACELLVQLDRSSVDAGDDSGCAICSDVTALDEDTEEEAEAGAGSTDAGTDATAGDDSADSSTPDAAVEDR
jgi:hypothetical protein